VDDRRDESESISVWDFCLLVCPRNGTSLYPGGGEGGEKQILQYLNKQRKSASIKTQTH